MRRIKIKLAYDGSVLSWMAGAARAADYPGCSGAIVSDMEGRPVHVAGSGRTDAGVHALEQVAAFSLENPIPVANLRRAVNRLLPPAVRVLSAEDVHADFHPRFDAKAKTYEYRMVREEVCSPFEWPFVHHYPYPLDGGAHGAVCPVTGRRARFHGVCRRRRARRGRAIEGSDGLFLDVWNAARGKADVSHPRQRLPEAHGAEHRGHADRGRPGKLSNLSQVARRSRAPRHPPRACSW